MATTIHNIEVLRAYLSGLLWIFRCIVRHDSATSVHFQEKRDLTVYLFQVLYFETCKLTLQYA